VGSTDKRSVRSFAVPHIPHNDVVLPEEIQASVAWAWPPAKTRWSP